MSECIQAPVEVRHRRKAQCPLAVFSRCDNLRVKYHVTLTSKLKPVPYAQLATRLHQSIPLPRIDLFGEQHFDASRRSLVFMRTTRSRSVQTRGYHTRIVQHQDVACAKLLREVRKDFVPPRARRAVQQEHTRSAALRRRLLRNQFFGQRKVKVGNQH